MSKPKDCRKNRIRARGLLIQKTKINEDLTIYTRSDVISGIWYLRINKQPTWRDKFSCSLGTSDKEKAITLAKQKYHELINEDQIRKNTKGMIFNEEDKIIATKNAVR